MGDKLEVGGGVGGSSEQHTSSAINVFVTGQPGGVEVSQCFAQLLKWADDEINGVQVQCRIDNGSGPGRKYYSGLLNEVIETSSLIIPTIGVGKSWLVLNAAKKLPQDVIAGFYTVEARNPKTGEKIGFDIQTFSGERAPLSRMRRGCGPKVGKYYFALDDFERVALPLLKPTEGIKLHIIDEVGRMELQSQRFRDALTALLSSSQTAVFGSLRAPRFGHDLQFVEDIKQREDTATLTLTKSNRDATAAKVEAILMNIVGSASVSGEARRREQTETLPPTDQDTNAFDTSKFLNSYGTSEEPQMKRTKISEPSE